MTFAEPWNEKGSSWWREVEVFIVWKRQDWDPRDCQIAVRTICEIWLWLIGCCYYNCGCSSIVLQKPNKCLILLVRDLFMGWIFISLRTAESWQEWYARDVLFIFISLLLFLLVPMLLFCAEDSQQAWYMICLHQRMQSFFVLFFQHIWKNSIIGRCDAVGGIFIHLMMFRSSQLTHRSKITRLPRIHDDYCWLQAITSFSILLLKLQLTYDNSKVQTIFVNHKMFKSLLLWA